MNYKKTTLKDVAKFEYGYTATAHDKGKFRLIRITDIDDFGLIKQDNKKYTDLSEENKKFILENDDILVARTGATYGKTAIYKKGDESKAVFASYLIRITLDHTLVLPKYYWFFAQSNYYWMQAKNLISGTGQPQFNANALGQIKLPLPTINEQEQIIEKLEKESELVNIQKIIFDLFQDKTTNKLDSIWQSEEENEPVADKSVFDRLINKASKPSQ